MVPKVSFFPCCKFVLEISQAELPEPPPHIPVLRGTLLHHAQLWREILKTQNIPLENNGKITPDLTGVQK